jgi:hypothetical protein
LKLLLNFKNASKTWVFNLSQFQEQIKIEIIVTKVIIFKLQNIANGNISNSSGNTKLIM